MHAIVSIIKSKENSTEKNMLLHGVKRTNTQLDRKYLDGGRTHPCDPVYQRCGYCNHEAIDEPPENGDVILTNKERQREH